MRTYTFPEFIEYLEQNNPDVLEQLSIVYEDGKGYGPVAHRFGTLWKREPPFKGFSFTLFQWIDRLVYWAYTPQGRDYWEKVGKDLGGREDIW